MIDSARECGLSWSLPPTDLVQVREFKAPEFFGFAQRLHWLEWTVFNLRGDGSAALTDNDFTVLRGDIARAREIAEFFYMPVTTKQLDRFEAALVPGCAYAQVQPMLEKLRERLGDELEGRVVFFMPAGQAVRYYSGSWLLGEVVVSKFPDLATDISEAAKCLSMARYTAAVFHLMRVMEAGVRAFGTHLGVDFKALRTWGPILDRTQKAIEKLPNNNPKKKALKALAASLFNVKDAWRNPVMHPAQSYTEAEAERVVVTTQAFMEALAALI